MNETELTKEIKTALTNSWSKNVEQYIKDGIFIYNTEVLVSQEINTYVDFANTCIMYDAYLTQCYEIKVSINDFNSKYGSNFYGNKNYYVVSQDIEEYVISKMNSNRMYKGIGLIVYRYNDSKYNLDHVKDSAMFDDSVYTYSIRDNLIDNGIYVGGVNKHFAQGILKIFDSIYVEGFNSEFHKDNTLLIQNLLNALYKNNK